MRYGNDLRNGTVSFQLLEQTARFTTGQLNIIGDVCFERKWSNRTQVKLIRITCTISDLQGSGIYRWKHWRKRLCGKSCLLVCSR
ncbi:hypothetical protein [Sporosarcina ureae]|uniref:magnesium chelatase subunit ChlI family protein n=1 Tax=Sporosarcina ureae TaxID=1571 RepID=UPI003B5A0627